MPAQTEDLSALIEQLRDRKSARRRSAAKALRRRQAAQAGPALLQALDHEMADQRTWETQYEMALALGECGTAEALPLLEKIAETDLKASTVSVGIGNAITRIEQRSDLPFRSLSRWLTEDAELAAAPRQAGAPPAGRRGLADHLAAFNRWLWTEKPRTAPTPRKRKPYPPPFPPGRGERLSALIRGSLQAAAMAGLVPDRSLIGKILRYASLPGTDHTRRWVAEACPGWSADGITEFLTLCLESPVVETREAAAAALKKQGSKP